MSKRRERKREQAEQGMTDQNFTMRMLKGDTWGVATQTLVGLLLMLPLFRRWDTFDIFFFFMIGGNILILIGSVRNAYWRCIVHRNEIIVRTFLRGERTINFYDIKRVRGYINLYSDSGKLFSVHPHAVGYKLFVYRLMQRNIEGVEKLADVPKPPPTQIASHWTSQMR